MSTANVMFWLRPPPYLLYGTNWNNSRDVDLVYCIEMDVVTLDLINARTDQFELYSTVGLLRIDCFKELGLGFETPLLLQLSCAYPRKGQGRKGPLDVSPWPQVIRIASLDLVRWMEMVTGLHYSGHNSRTIDS